MKPGRAILQINTHSALAVPNFIASKSSLQCDSLVPSAAKLKLTRHEDGVIISGLTGQGKPTEVFVPDANIVFAVLKEETNVVDLKKK